MRAKEKERERERERCKNWKRKDSNMQGGHGPQRHARERQVSTGYDRRLCHQVSFSLSLSLSLYISFSLSFISLLSRTLASLCLLSSLVARLLPYYLSLSSCLIGVIRFRYRRDWISWHDVDEFFWLYLFHFSLPLFLSSLFLLFSCLNSLKIILIVNKVIKQKRHLKKKDENWINFCLL